MAQALNFPIFKRNKEEIEKVIKHYKSQFDVFTNYILSKLFVSQTTMLNAQEFALCNTFKSCILQFTLNYASMMLKAYNNIITISMPYYDYFLIVSIIRECKTISSYYSCE